MSVAIFVLMMLNFAYIGLLPVVFFRRDGRLNLRWWLTASPFFISALLVALHFFGQLQSWVAEAAALREAVAALLGVLSIGLISYTLGTHKRRLALWHQDNDAPQHLVTEGAYKRIRHPFYAAFIAALVASALLCAAPVAAAVSLLGLVMLNYTAAREERRLLASAFGDQYRAYLARSGRFFPSLRAVRS